TQIVGGVVPGKGGQTHLDRPVFNSVAEGVEATGANASVVFVPPRFAADSILEAIDAGIEVIVAITEGIPVLDMLRVKNVRKAHQATLVTRPNYYGAISPDECKTGIVPGQMHKVGKVGPVSRAGTQKYEKEFQTTKEGLRLTNFIDIGGDAYTGL